MVTTTRAPKTTSKERAIASARNPNFSGTIDTTPVALRIGVAAVKGAWKASKETVQWGVKHPKKSLSATIAAAAILHGIVPTSSSETTPGDTCTDATHALYESHDGIFSDPLTFDDIAKSESAKRHYLMTAEELQAANVGQDLLQRDDKKKLTDDFKDGLHCVDLPAPVVGGFAVTGSHDTVADIATANAISAEQFLQFNPQFAGKKAEDVLPSGIEVKVRDSYDASFVLVPSATGDIAAMAGADSKERDAYLSANSATLSLGHAVTKGHEAYIRTPQKVTTYVMAFDKDGTYRDYVAQHMPPAPEANAASAESTLPQGFAQQYVASIQTEEAAWAQHPDPAKYMPGETNLDQNWCAFFVLYNLNQGGANLQPREQIDDAHYYLPRVSDLWNYMTNAHNPDFYSYNFHALRDGSAQPRAGDVIFFNWKDSWEKFQASIQNHVGTVVGYNAETKTITTVEGNAGNNGDIETKTYNINDPRIMGISRPVEQAAVTVTNVSEKPEVLPPAPELDDEQQAIGKQIIDIGHQRGLSDTDIVTAINVAMQESNMHNRMGGDRDSGGVFQQRPSVLNHDGTPYWGTYDQVTNPEYAINRFYDDLMKVSNRAEEPMLEVALDVQDPSRAAYESPTHNFVKREPLAWAIFAELKGPGV